MIEALILFGSHARGDQKDISDLDVIAVMDEVPEKSFEKEALSISFYSKKFLIKISSIGNLFALHLVCEAKPIFDPNGVLEEMRSAFRKKTNYCREIADASMLGWFLIRHTDKITIKAYIIKELLGVFDHTNS